MPALLAAPRPPAPAVTPRPVVSPRQRWFRQEALLGALALVFLLLRVCYAFVQRVDSDEPQHLHVAWGWAQGLLPYRDFFDNHTPLFGLLFAPVLRLVGDRADVVPWMRLAMLPLYGVGLGCVYRISRALGPRRVARWTPLLAGLYPPFFDVATEFRTDALWCVLWLAAVAVLVGGAATPRRALAAGLLLGAAAGVSLKTVLLLAALGLALAGTFALRGFATGNWPWRRGAALLAAGLVGLAVVPAAVAGFFAASGAWGALAACTVGHHDAANLAVPGEGHTTLGHLAAGLALAGLGPAGFLLLRAGAGRREVRRLLVFLTAGAYAVLLVGFWPTLTRQNYLPLYPLAAVPVVAAGWAAATRGPRRVFGRAPWWLPGAIALLEVALIFRREPPWINHAQGTERQVGTVLRLTAPGEFVMDAKGAAVFRPRPYYPVLETFTMREFRAGRRRDDIAERLAATGTAVVIRAGLPERSQAWVEANYLPVGAGVGVAGKLLGDPGPDGEIRFPVALAARYALISRRGEPAAGWLDGEPCDGQPRTLAAGPHRFRPAAGGGGDAGAPVLFWARAYERGFLPAANWSVKFPNADRRAGT